MEELRMIALVRQAQTGDRDAFGELSLAWQSMVFAVALRRLRNSAEAAEVAQDVFLRAFRKIDQLRKPERFAGWLKRIAVQLSINRAVRQPRETIQDPLTFRRVSTQLDTPWAHLVRGEQAGELHRGLSRLRQLDRETLQAFYFDGQSIREMSHRFGSPEGTIKRRLHTARLRLRETLEELQPA